jgi:hypothetical protein
MKDTKQTNEHMPSTAATVIGAGIAGAIAGGVAVAAMMNDKHTQKKIADAMTETKKKVTDMVDAVKSQPAVKKAAIKGEAVLDAIKK